MLPEKTLEDTLKIAGVVSAMSSFGPVLYRSGSANGSELSFALEDFAKEVQNISWALAGGLAIGFHSRPRGTQDVGVIVENEGDIEKIEKKLTSFKKNRSHTFEHKRTRVEVEVLTAEFLNINHSIVEKAIETSEKHNFKGNAVPVIDKAGLIALKLQRGNRQDLADIEAILQKDKNVDCSEYPLTEEQKNTLEEIRKDVGP